MIATETVVPGILVEMHAQGFDRGELVAAALHADVTGFSALTEEMVRRGKSGAEELSAALRASWEPLMAAVEEEAGFVATMEGDSFTALFQDDGASDARAAARRAAERMLARLAERRADATARARIEVTIGLSYGLVGWGIVSLSDAALPYFTGPAIRGCASARARASRGGLATDPEAPLIAPAPGEPQRRAEGSPAPPFLAAAAAAFPEGGELRDATTLFVGIDDTEADRHALVRGLHARVARRGGSIARLGFGDKGPHALVFFGAPVAHEDDPARGMEAALDLLQLPGRRRRLRMGIDRGLSWAGWNGTARRRELTCLGDGTNRASRLMLEAEWGQVLASARIVARTRDRFVFEDLGERTLRGIPLPQPVYVPTARRSGLTQEIGSSRALIGRGYELSRLVEIVESAFAGRGAKVVYLDGPAGMGKSWLVKNTRAHLAENCRFLVASADAAMPISFHAFVHALRRAFSRPKLGAQTDDAIAHGLADLATAVEETDAAASQRLRRGVRRLSRMAAGRAPGSRAAADPDMEQERTARAVVAWLKAESIRGPLLLHVDDAHALDVDSLQVLLQAAAELRELPAAIVVTGRPGDDGTPYRLVLPDHVTVDVVELRGLTLSEVGELMTELHERPVSPDLATMVWERTGGNPLFVEQLAWWLLERGGRLEGGAMLPDGLHALFTAQLDRLPAPVREIVQAASVLGSTFSPAVLARMLPEASVASHVGVAGRRGVWKEVEAAPAGDGVPAASSMTFTHALMRDAAYEMQPSPRLRELHARAAAALMEVDGLESLERAVAVAGHWERGLRHARARALLVPAAMLSLHHGALGDAERLLRRALSSSPSASADAAAVRNLLGEALRLMGQVGEARAEHETALVLAASAGDGEGEATALLGIAEAIRDTSAVDEVAERCRRGARRGLEHGHPRLAVRALQLLANLELRQGHAAEARQGYVTCLDLVTRTGDARLEGSLVADLARLNRMEGKWEEALAGLERALAIARSAGDRRAEGRYLANLGSAHFDRGEMEEARATYEGAIAVCREVEDRGHEAVCLGNLATIHLGQGRTHEARALFEAGLDLEQRIGNRRMEGVFLERLAIIQVAMGQLEEADALLLRSLESCRRFQDRRNEPQVLVTLADVARRRGRFDDAARHLEPAIESVRDLGDPGQLAMLTATAAVVEAERGDHAAARRLAGEALSLSEGREGARRALVHLHAGDVALHGGRLADAREAFAAALLSSRARGEAAEQTERQVAPLAAQRQGAIALVLRSAARCERLAGELARARELALEAAALVAAGEDVLERLDVSVELAWIELASGEDPGATLVQARRLLATTSLGDDAPLAREIAACAAAAAAAPHER